MKTRLIQMEVSPGRPSRNARAMLAWIQAARADGIDLIVFPEMAVPGYLIGDEWERPAFLRECERCGESIREAARGITVVFGNVGLDWNRRNEDGRVRKYNALFVAEDGRFVAPRGGPYAFVIKTLLPNYREFDDSRHFYDLRKLALEEGRAVQDLIAPVPSKLASLGCILCEDAWDIDYAISPLSILKASDADLFVNISASPFTFNKNHKRNRVFSAHARDLGRPMLYVNHVGIQNNGKTIFTFDGSSCVYDHAGGILNLDRPFQEAALTVELTPGAPPVFDKPIALREDTIEILGEALMFGTRRFMASCGIERVVIGASGGVDSAVAAALYRRLLDADRLLIVNMPSRHNSATTQSLARELAANLGCLYAEVPIDDSVALTRGQIHGLEAATVRGDIRQRLALSDFHLENVQARDRSARILAAVASAFGGAFTCNANKSEMTVGYTTLYGDLGGFLANLADLWKTEIYALAAHLNVAVYESPVIPDGVLTLPPSAELSPAQDVDKGLGDPLHYAYHDQLFKSWVEWWDRAAPEDILGWYAAGELADRLEYAGSVNALFPDATAFVADLEHWWNRYQGLGLAKRIQAPPVLAVKKRVFGFDHRESQMGPLYTTAYADLKASLLATAPSSP